MSQEQLINEEMFEMSPSSECSGYVYEEVEQFQEHYESCCLCPEGVKLQNQLIEHLQNQHPNGSFQCCSCGDGVQIQVDLVNHLMSHIVEVKSVSDNTNLIIETIEIEDPVNVEQKKPSKPSYRNLYNRRERSPNTQKTIEEFTKNPETKLFHCNFCMTGYKHKQTVERHLMKEHYPEQTGFDNTTGKDAFIVDSKTRFFKCAYCENSYKHKQTIERHLEKEHCLVVPKIRLKNKPPPSVFDVQPSTKMRKEKNLVCDMCGQCFLFRESMRKHLLRHVNRSSVFRARKIPKEKIVCDQCTKLVDPSFMKRHIQVHHSDYRPFKCEEPGCTTTFFDITKFKDHQNIHLKIKPYVCDFCQESFHYASNLRQHILRHTQPERFKCEVCSHCFVSTKSLRLHMRLHSEVDPDAPKPFACDHERCDKAFRYLDRLKLHIYNVHRYPAMDSEYKCSICSFVTHRKKYHKRHMLKIHNIREGKPRKRVFPTNILD